MADKERPTRPTDEFLRLAKTRALFSYFPELTPLLKQIIPGYPEKMNSVLVRPNYSPELVAPDLTAFDKFSLYDQKGNLIARISYINNITRSVSGRYGGFSLTVFCFLEGKAINLLYDSAPYPPRSTELPEADLTQIKINNQEVKADQLGSDLQQIIPDKISYTGPIKARPPELDINPEPIRLANCSEIELKDLAMAKLLARIPVLPPSLTSIIFAFLDQSYRMETTAWDKKSLGLAFYQEQELAANLSLAEYWRKPSFRGEKFQYRGFTFEFAWTDPETARFFLIDYTGSGSYKSTTAELWIAVHPQESRIYCRGGEPSSIVPAYCLKNVIDWRQRYCTCLDLTGSVKPKSPDFKTQPEPPLAQGLEITPVENGGITINGYPPAFEVPFSLTLPLTFETTHPGIKDTI